MEGEIIIEHAGVKLLFFSCGRLIVIAAGMSWEIWPIFVMSFFVVSIVDFLC